MRWRLLAFLPPAAFLAIASLMGAASLVAGLESRVRPPVVAATPVTWIESDCRRLEREMREVSRRATGCDADLRCLGSPILCPISMDEAHEREYQALRRDHEARCVGATETAPVGAVGASTDPTCPALSQAFDDDAVTTDRTGATFVF